MRIVAIDFETANNRMSSACSLGISIYEDGELKDSYAFFIRPPHNSLYFTNTFIHHITLEDVINEKEFDYYYMHLCEVFKDAILVAHNARFDLAVLNAMCDEYDLPHFNNQYLDTVILSRRFYPNLINHRLNTISEYLGVALDHHEAKSDAYACLMIILDIMDRCECYEIDDLLQRFGFRKRFNK